MKSNFDLPLRFLKKGRKDHYSIVQSVVIDNDTVGNKLTFI